MMKFVFKFLLIMLSLTWSSFALAESHSPEGFWISTHPNFQKPLGIIKIVEYKNELLGELIKITPVNKAVSKTCRHCKAYLRTKPLTGPIVMFNFKKNGNGGRRWSGGKIIDSETARLYTCSLKLAKDGQRLYVTAHEGIFRQTTVWRRIKKKKIIHYGAVWQFYLRSWAYHS